MALQGAWQSVLPVLRQVEPIVVLQQLGCSLYDTALQMVVRDRCTNASSPDDSSRQKAMADFYMTYHMIMQLMTVLPMLLLARLSDRGWRRLPIVLPLVGYLLSRLTLLLVILLRAPLAVMFAGAALYSLTGGYGAYWSGVMTLASLNSTAKNRSKVIMRVEVLYGMAGLVGSLVSGHLFHLYSSSVGNGTIMLALSLGLHILSFMHAVFLLQVKEVPSSETEESNHLVFPEEEEVSVEAPARKNMTNVILLFIAAILYDISVGGAMEILGIFVMKAPLSWNATQVGYGNAAGNMIFLTSFLGVMLLSRWFSDVSLILIGMLSFASGIYFMSFVTATYMFYLARSLNLFALIPMPTIRSLLSQQVPKSSYGIILTMLQLVLKFAGMAYIPIYTRIYQHTLDWFPGFVFTLSTVFTVLGMIPISLIGCRSGQRPQYNRIQ
ncbi:thymic stromal cotransporter homolog [Thalassophryne amazonica]|uniref:thymic stromal cotransporter homolog n=1 Tax=Thalassophryne amazonica TaxID=390379 RepID=UPI00147237F6|nr:thymic stromal cotransporter homolog [Thalassophryne amazonica]